MSGLPESLAAPGRHQGFTLIEVLLVVLLMGIVSGMVLLAANPSDPSRVVAGEADRLEEAISLAQDSAINDNEQYGLLATEDGYLFLVYDDASRQWLPSTNPAFASYKLPEEVILEVSAAETPGGNGKNDARPLQGKGGKEALKPQMLLLSSGESTATLLEVSAEGVVPEKLKMDDIGNLLRNPDVGAAP